MRFLRHALIASAALVPVVALTGCDRNPSTAAYVGDQTVSISKLQNAVNAGYKDQSVQAAWSSQEKYRGQVLQNQVLHELLEQAAERAGISASSGAGARIGNAFPELFQNGKSDADAALVKQGVAPSQPAGYFDDLALTGQLAIKRGLLSVVSVGAIAVPDLATAKKIGTAVQADESSYSKLAAKYAGPGTPAAPIDLTSLNFAQDFIGAPASAVRSPHTGFVIPIPNANGYWAVHVFATGLPWNQMSDSAQANVGYTGMQSLQRTLLKKPGVRIRVNPRFGSWNAKSGTVKGAQPPTMLAKAKK